MSKEKVTTEETQENLQADMQQKPASEEELNQVAGGAFYSKMRGKPMPIAETKKNN